MIAPLVTPSCGKYALSRLVTSSEAPLATWTVPSPPSRSIAASCEVTDERRAELLAMPPAAARGVPIADARRVRRMREGLRREAPEPFFI